MTAKQLPETVVYRRRSYRRVQAQQLQSVYVGTIYAEEHIPYDSPAYGAGVEVGPPSTVAVLAAHDLNKLKGALRDTETTVMHGLQKLPTNWNIQLLTDIKAQNMGEFSQQVRDEWTNADQILRDVALGKTVVLENLLDEFTRM